MLGYDKNIPGIDVPEQRFVMIVLLNTIWLSI